MDQSKSEETLFVREAGDPAGPPVIFIHAGPLSSKMWQPQLERLPDLYCIAPDLPGHGESRSLGPFNLKDAARRVADLIREKVPGGKANVVGLSLGGAVLMTLLNNDPDVVERAMVSGAAARMDRFTGQMSLATLWMLKYISVEKQTDTTFRQMGIPPSCRDLVYDDLVKSSSEDYIHTVLVALMSMSLPASIQCPLLVAVGEKETLPARQAARKLLRLYPESRGIIAPGLHHLWSLQNPDLFSDTVRAWVKDEPLPSGLRLV